MRTTTSHLILWAVALSTAAAQAQEPPGSPAAASLRQAVTKHLDAGRIDAALEAAQRGLADYPDEPALRDEFVWLHLALARQMLAEEKFATAERALQALLKVAPAHREARRLMAGIQLARRRTRERVERARRWVDLEWFEPAFNTFRQARALHPEQRDEWTAMHVQAALGAGDDHYLCKNFHEAFYYYDAAMTVENDAGPAPSRSPATRRTKGPLAARWLFSMVHALGEDVDRVHYPPAYWNRVLGGAEGRSPDDRRGKELRTVLRGLAYENTGRLERAASEYAAVLGRPVATLDPVLIRRSRQDVLKATRRWYAGDLRDRRGGFWSRTGRREWQLLETARFRIHHRNDRAAQRVADALRFHFDRVATFLGRDPGRVPWGQACDVYLHANAAAFGKATGQPGTVRAISIVRHRGARLEGHEIHAHQADPMLLSTSLPHELAHLMQAAITGYQPAVAAVNEGIALHIEPRCRHVQFARLFGRLEKPRSVAALLKTGEVHPPEPAFYAESHRLLAVLLARSDGSTLLARSVTPMDRRQMATLFGFPSVLALEKTYRGR